MIRSMQDLLNAGVNAFAVRLLAKDFARMRESGPMEGPVHVPIPIAQGKVIWVTFSDVPPAEAQPAEPAKELGPAAGPAVPVEKTKAEIEGLLRKRGSSRFGSMEDRGQAVVVFELKGKAIRFTMPLPARDEERFTQDPRRTWKRRPDEVAYKLWEQACREKWRALLLSIKAMFSNVDSGILSFEQAFLPFILMPDGKTVAEHVLPRVEEAYLGGKSVPLLPAGEGS